MKIGLLDGKLLLSDDKLHLVDDEIDEDCCCGNGDCIGSCVNGLIIKKQCNMANENDPPTPNLLHWSQNSCHRLLVYENTEICNNRIRSISVSPDYIIVTNSEGSNDGGPFYVTDNDPDSGLLDERPLWWDDCLIGGWEEGSVGSDYPSVYDIENNMDCCSELIGVDPGPTILSNGLYRVYVLMRYKRAYLHTNTPFVLISKNPESDSAAKIVKLGFSLIGTIEGCEEEEIERATCPIDAPVCP